ncbi:MAG: hypothetical protein N4A74_13975 [Carboxylicivirga sp.]|jgi:hypothetical protein|nr:hypothetical protein [Carboxylicivirga sp.]
MKEEQIRTDVILSLQRSLIGNISGHVRVICCSWNDKEWFRLRFYIDIEPNNIEKELMSVVLTEFENDIQFEKYYEELIFTKDPFEKLEKLKLVMFWKNELEI